METSTPCHSSSTSPLPCASCCVHGQASCSNCALQHRIPCRSNCHLEIPHIHQSRAWVPWTSSLSLRPAVTWMLQGLRPGTSRCHATCGLTTLSIELEFYTIMAAAVASDRWQSLHAVLQYRRGQVRQTKLLIIQSKRDKKTHIMSNT